MYYLYNDLCSDDYCSKFHSNKYLKSEFLAKLLRYTGRRRCENILISTAENKNSVLMYCSIYTIVLGN